jgi:hypothetical protein
MRADRRMKLSSETEIRDRDIKLSSETEILRLESNPKKSPAFLPEIRGRLRKGRSMREKI